MPSSHHRAPSILPRGSERVAGAAHLSRFYCGTWSHLLPPCLALLTLAACDSAPPHAWPVSIQVTSTDGKPIAAVPLWQSDQRHLGLTSEQGTLNATVLAHPSDTMELHYRCPGEGGANGEDTDGTSEERLTLPGVPEQAVPPLLLRCHPSRDLKSIVVRLSGTPVGPIPIEVSGEVVGQTEQDGTAHLQLRIPGQQRVRIVLNTTASPGLSPQHPVFTFEARAEHELWLIDQLFEAQPQSVVSLKPASARPKPTIPAKEVRSSAENTIPMARLADQSTQAASM